MAQFLGDRSNRLVKQVNVAGGGATYKYRADGMRVQKATGVSLVWWYDEVNDSAHYDEIIGSNAPTTRYFYDGQMTMEEDYTTTSGVDVTQYGPGARGIDYIKTIPYSGSSTEKFPLYDGHGNMLATLSRSGSAPYYTVQDGKAYDVWGGIRSGSGGPKQNYCANLGHQNDGESGLVYMRARYYESWTGRFISEDKRCDGTNWYVYAGNDPVGFVDPSGNSLLAALMGLIKFLLGHLLIDEIDPVVNRISEIERYLADIDDLIAEANSSRRWADQALELRKEAISLRKTLKRFQAYEKVRKFGTNVANVLGKLMGRMMIISALIDDIDLGPEGYGSLELVYGS